MKQAVNPQTGEVVFLVNNEWVSPLQTATNEAGEKAFLVNNQWYVPPVPTAPTLSPEEQVMSSIGADTTGGIQASDYGKLFGAGAVKGTLGAPEAVIAGTSGISRDTTTKPTEILNYLADPRKLANDLAQAVRLPKIFEDDAKVGIVPEKTVAKQKAAVDEALTKGKLQSLRDLTEYGSKISSQIEDSVTPEMKQALADSQPTGNIIEAFQTGDFSKISLGSAPSVAGIAGQASKVFGSTAPSLLIAVASKSPTVGGIAGFGQAGSEGVETAREHIKAMSNEDLAKNSEYFRNLLVMGYTPEMARRMTEDKAADTAAYYQGVVGALGTTFTANLLKGKFDDALIKSASTRLGRIAKGTAVGMTEEGLQELAEGVATDLGIDRTVVRELGVDSFANVVLGAIGGGVPGGVRGAIARDKTEVPPAPPEVAPTVTPVTPEATPSAAPVAAVPPVPPAPVSGAISETELETAEEPTAPVAAKPSEAMVAIVDEDGNVTDEVDKVNLNDLYEEDGKIYVRGEFYDHDLMSVLADLKDEGQKMELVKRAENLMPTQAAEEEVVKTTAEPSEAQKNLDEFLSQDKDETIKKIAEGNNVDLKLAEQAYEAEKEFREAKAKYYTPQLINSPELKAAQKKHTVFFNKLRQTGKKAKAVPVVAEPEEERVLTRDEIDAKYAGASKQVDRIKELSNIGDEDRTDEEDDFLDAAHRELNRTAERISGPPRKKGYVSSGNIDVNQFGNKWVAGSTYMGTTGGYGLGVSYDSDQFDSREEAINAEIDKMRPYAQSQKDAITLKWLDSIDSRIEAEAPKKAQTKEEKAEANRKRQEEKKAKAAEEKAATKKQEKEDFDREMDERRQREENQRKKTAEESKRRKEIESLKLTKFEDDTGIPPRDLKEANALVDETEEEYGDAARNYIKTGEGKDLVEKARAKHDAAIKEFNKTVREIRGEEQVEDEEEADEKGNYTIDKDSKSEIIEGVDGRVKIYVREITDKDPKNIDGESLAGKWLQTKIYKTPDGSSYGPGMTPKSTPTTYDSREEAIASAINLIKYLDEKESKRTNRSSDTEVLEFLDTLQPKAEERIKEAHIEGNKSEPVTTKTIEEAIDKAETKVDYKKIKQAVKNQFDQAIKRATIKTEKDWNASTVDENSYVTISIPGDGKFKVKNNVERLTELQTKIINAVEPKGPKKTTGVTSGTLEAFKAMVDESDMENAIEYAKLKGLDIKEAKLSPKQRSTVDSYLKNPAEFERQKEEAESLESARAEALRRDQEKRIAERLAEDEKREEKARFDAVLDTTIRSTESQLKRDIAAKKISLADARAMLEVFPRYPEGTVKPYTIRLIEKRAGAEPSFKKLRKTETEDGYKIQNPLMVGLVDDGYEMLDLRNPRTYVDKNGTPHRTFEKNGVRIALTAGEKLFQTAGKENQAPQTGIGNDNDVHFNALLVDPEIRKQGKAKKAINDVTFLADKNKLTVYLEPVQLEDGGMSKDQLSKLYAEFQFKPTNESGKVMKREPESYEETMARVNAKMEAEGRESEYSRLARELAELKAKAQPEAILTPPQQKILEKEVDKLSDSEIATLEQHYGVDNYSLTFLKKVREDAVKYINDGANAVDKAVRSIISKIAAAILSVAIVFNPNYMSDASAVVLPQVVTQVVQAEVPTEAKGMSESGKKAYATLYPAIKQELQKNNKYFTVVDKPTSKVYVFNPDGSLMTQSTVLLGKAFGDTYVGKTDFKGNRITPAGLFKPKAEKGSATYDGKTVYTLENVKEGWNAVFMHTVYLKESDAKDRLKALETGEGTRLSYGCINGPTALMEKIDNESMNESHIFIVPDNQAATDDYIANRVSNEDLTRETVTPVTKKVPAPRAKTMTEQEVFGREEELALAPRKTQAEINRDRQQARKAASTSEDKGIFFGNFTGEMSEADKKAMREEIREEKIIQKGVISRKISTLVKKIASVGGDLETQKRLNYLTSTRADLTNYIKATKPERRSADWFRARATDELAKGNLMPETMAVIDELYKKYPSFLEGLKLSVQAGKRVGVEGSFEPIQRLVTIYKNPFSVTQDETMRHEIMHSLEQMMTPEAQIALVNAWADALSKAMKKHTDERSQLFFNAVLDYIENPTKANYRKATNKLPDLSFYQYMNPSEFWAVNGEKLMKSQLGNSWARFVKGVQKILEALKNVFGFDNRYAVHREFDRLMKAESGQMTDTMLADYLKQNDVEIEFLNQVEDVDELLDRHERPDTPLHPSDSVKDRLLDKVEDLKGYRDRVRANPKVEAVNMVGSVDRAITYARNKNVWFGTGLELADLKKYMGQLRDSNGFAIASIALTNALHAGHVATQVITQGGLRFDPIMQQFTAYASKYSLANVVREKAKLVKQLGEQRASNLINSFFEAKRSRSIQNEFYNRQAEYETLKQKFEAAVETEEKDQLYKDMVASREALERVSVAMDKVNMTDEAIDDFIAMEKKFPELREMMKNWTAVNQNMIDNMEFSGIISKKRAAQLREIEDYVPWYRIQDEMADPHDPVSSGVRGLTNVGKEKKFKKGATDKDIDDIVDNMIHNVMMTTRNSIRNYAANRIAMEYATRNDKDKIKVFPKEGVMPDGAVRVNILANGRRIVIEIKDPLIAEAVLGMESIEIPMYNVLGMMANGLRRGITTFPIFQVKQLFMDAPTAAWVSGVKNPFAVWGKTFGSFVAALNPNDPIVKMMKSYGIGGYQSSARTPEKELKLQIGLIGRSPFARMMRILDHIGDASDYAQRRAIYKQVLKETGDEMQALIQANNVIDFLKHGSAKHAQFLTRTVSFMNAYAQSVDVLAQSMAGGGLKGKERSKVFAQFVKTGMILAGLSLLYSFAVGDDEEYQKMDDQTKLRNFIIPKSLTKLVGMENSVKIPMHTTASFFFKSMPELLYNKIMNEGTKNHVDNQRLRTAMREAAVDALLGPNVTPTGVKPFLEIALNRNFFTGGALTPKGMENLEAFRQYTANTSELGKVISKGTFGVLNPIEADHLMKSLLGTVGASAMWGSNLFSGDRVEPNASANPLYGAFVSAPVPRGPEDIYYDLKERSTKVYTTYIDMMKKGRTEEGKKYRSENEALFKAYGYTNGVEQGLKQLNAEIRRIGDLPGDKLSGAEKRERITYYQGKKNDILKDVIEYRKRAGL